ncbi:hypothetical protein N7510_007890 [Penicillium lagena]|uniref:uncharacterized protein n=1 Tax=Penicillium lagena TaxID=94218 RepID=UPI00253FFA15|nr:uncharacterized protein N7510_007890 [Penicillium lagena]KAJ5611171.1 hypothetical protein N7510_007890 [Penicillium lagena]
MLTRAAENASNSTGNGTPCCVEQDGRRRPYHATRAVWKPTSRCSEPTLGVSWPLSSRPGIPFEAFTRARGPGLCKPLTMPSATAATGRSEGAPSIKKPGGRTVFGGLLVPRYTWLGLA